MNKKQSKELIKADNDNDIKRLQQEILVANQLCKSLVSS